MLITNENYREYPAISYSKLSKVSKNPKSCLDNSEINNRGITFGDVLDILLTQNEEKFYEEYLILTSSEDKPTGQLGDFIDELYRQHKKNDVKINWDIDIPILDEYLIKDSYNIVGFKRDSQPKVVDRLLTEGLRYLRFLTSSENKKVIAYEVYKSVLKAKETLLNHEFTKEFWDNLDEDVKILYQEPIQFHINDDLEGKALLDILIINHKLKVIQPIDLKSTGEYLSKFPSNFLKYQYYLQASYYSYGLKIIYPDYTILPFRFIVISQLQLDQPLIYQCTEDDLKTGEFGGINKITNTRVKGWRQLIEDYLWHKEKDFWEYPKEVYEKHGVIELNMLKYE